MNRFRYSRGSSILESAKALNKNVYRLSEEELDILLEKVSSSFTGDLRFPLWEGIEGSTSIEDHKGWLSVRSLINQKETILFLDPNDEQFGIKVKDGNDLVDILDECGYIVFYMTNPALDYLLAFNDHDYLIVKGTLAEEWMKGKYNSPKWGPFKDNAD